MLHRILMTVTFFSWTAVSSSIASTNDGPLDQNPGCCARLFACFKCCTPQVKEDTATVIKDIEKANDAILPVVENIDPKDKNTLETIRKDIDTAGDDIINVLTNNSTTT